MTKRVIWTAGMFGLPWVLYGIAQTFGGFYTFVAFASVFLAVACWTYPGWDW